MIVLMVAVVFSIDVANMQLTRMELRTAVDAVARAGAESLSREQDPALALARAQEGAGLNKIGQDGFTLPASDVTFGRVDVTSSGVSTYQAGVNPPNALRIVTGGSVSDLQESNGEAIGSLKRFVFKGFPMA